MSRRDAAAILAMCSWVRKQVSKIEDRAKLEADVSFPDEKTAGVVSGTVVSYTSRISRKPELEILDESAFIGWVAEHYPTEITMAVQPRFVTELRDRALDTGAVLGPGGEVCEVAKLGEPVVYTSTRLQRNADEVLAPLLDWLSLSELPTYIEEEA